MAKSAASRCGAFGSTCSLAALVLLLGGAGCAWHRTAEASEYHSPLAKVQRLLDLDFSPASRRRSLDALDTALVSPWAEMQRTHDLIATAQLAWQTQKTRIERWPGRVPGLFAGVGSRLSHLRQRFPELPRADDFANTLARDLSHTTRFLGLERRPLGEPSDPEHRTRPTDDRPVLTWWQRLQRRILP